MSKITGPKGALLAGALAAGLTGCGGGNGTSTPEQNINHSPEITGTPSSISMTEGTKKEVANIICQDPDGDTTNMSVLSGNSNLKVNYNPQTNKLELDTSSWDLADGVNEDVNVTLTCSDGDLNTTKNMEVVVQDEINDKYMTYTTNIANSIVSNTVLNGSITLNDPDGQLSSSYNFDLVDENNNIVYSGVIEDVNSDGNYTFSIDFPNLSLPAGNYIFKTEEIYPVDGGENYQGSVVIEQNITLEAPTFSLSGPTSGNDGGSYVISLNTNQDLSKLTFRYRGSYNENGDGQDYEGVITLGSTAMGGILSLDNNGNLTIDTTVTGYGDATSMGPGDWIEFEVEDNETGEILIQRFTVNEAPIAQNGNFPGNGLPTYTFNISNLISDNESPDSELSVEIVTQPTGTDGTIRGNASVNGTDITINLNDGEAGTTYIEYKVIDPQGAESEVKKITIYDMDNA